MAHCQHQGSAGVCSEVVANVGTTAAAIGMFPIHVIIKMQEVVAYLFIALKPYVCATSLNTHSNVSFGFISVYANVSHISD